MNTVTSGGIREQVNDEEWQVRVDLAACYRIIAMHGWDDLIFYPTFPQPCRVRTNTF